MACEVQLLGGFGDFWDADLGPNGVSSCDDDGFVVMVSL